MLQLTLNRLAQTLIALWVLSAIVFLMGHATGSPLDVLLPLDATKADYQRLEKALGLDKPLYVQYGLFLGNVLSGNMGDSLRSREPVTKLIGERLSASMLLGIAAMSLMTVGGLLLGILAATNRGRAWDTLVKALALVGQSMPTFWVGILLIQIVSVRFELLPSGGNSSVSSLILPAVTLSLAGLAKVARLLRASMLEVLDSEFIKLARAKGLSEFKVVWKHALRNALIPVVTFGGMHFATLVTYAITVEVVFAWPGMGSLVYSAIIYRDFPVMQGLVLTSGVVVLTVNLVVDVLYGVIDPRVRHEQHS